MVNRIKLQAFFLVCVMTTSLLQPVFAQTTSSPGTITGIGTGWSSATFGIATSAP